MKNDHPSTSSQSHCWTSLPAQVTGTQGPLGCNTNYLPPATRSVVVCFLFQEFSNGSQNYYLNSKQIFVLKNYENDFKESLENIADKLSTSTGGRCPSQPCLSLSPPHAASATVFTPKALPVGMTSPTTAGVWALEASWRTNWQEALFFSTGDRTPSNLPKTQDITDPLLKTGW